MKLLEVLKDIEYKVLKGDLDHEIQGICYDSRCLKANQVFVAVKGFESDGHAYIDKVIAKGCRVVVLEEPCQNVQADVTLIQVDDSRTVMGLLGANFYGRPSQAMNLIGITGTNGKTSITYFIQSILKAQKTRLGIVGTIGVWIHDTLYKTKNTTPESVDLQGFFARMVKDKVDYCMMEVSSHALALRRVDACDFNTAIYTNLSPDHLELHGDMESYFEAKALLFDMARGKNIINIDDDHGQVLYQRHKDKSLTYGLRANADVYATEIVSDLDGSQFVLKTPQGSIDVSIQLPGQIYIYNALAAAAWACSENIALEVIARGLGNLDAIRGRLETVYKKDKKRIIIDFAHTEDSLEKALLTLRPFVGRQLKVVFGVYAAPGALGLDKRQAMARVASTYSDLAYVTSDNPKMQDPKAIIDDIVEEMDKVGGCYKACVDRKKAIHLALSEMKSGDVLLIAGKGHETSQVINGQEIPFSEKDIVVAYMHENYK